MGGDDSESQQRKEKPIKEFVIVTSRDSFGWLKTMAASPKGKNPTNG